MGERQKETEKEIYNCICVQRSREMKDELKREIYIQEGGQRMGEDTTVFVIRGYLVGLMAGRARASVFRSSGLGRGQGEGIPSRDPLRLRKKGLLALLSQAKRIP